MKYFKCTSEFDPEDEFYTTSSSDKTTAEDIAELLRLDHYKVEECTKEEFDSETEDDEEADPKMRALSLLDAIREYVSDWTTKVHLEGKVVTEDELQGLGASLYTLNQEIERI